MTSVMQVSILALKSAVVPLTIEWRNSAIVAINL